MAEKDVGGLKNVIFDEAPFAHNLSPFIDIRPEVPESERYKALAGTRKSGLYAFASGDGVHWKKMSDAAGLPPGFQPDEGVHCGQAATYC